MIIMNSLLYMALYGLPITIYANYLYNTDNTTVYLKNLTLHFPRCFPIPPTDFLHQMFFLAYDARMIRTWWEYEIVQWLGKNKGKALIYADAYPARTLRLLIRTNVAHSLGQYVLCA